MKKLIPMILFLSLALSLCACSNTGKNSSEAAAPVTPIIENPDAGRSHGEIMAEVRSCIFPAEGEKNIDTALEILLPLVEEGDAEAQYYMGWIYDYELEENDETEKESLHWYELAMNQGYLKAYIGVALNGFVESEEKADEAVNEAIERGLLELSEEELGADGMLALGSLYYSGRGVEQDYEQARSLCLKSAELGNARAMILLGNMYINGYGVDLDYTQAYDWYLKAAELGSAIAMKGLGDIFYNGVGVEQDHKQAFDWYLKSAELGNDVGMNWVGHMYYNGYGVEQDIINGCSWIIQSAAAGNAHSMSYAGWLYENGVIWPKDDAMGWYIDAYLNGLDDAIDSINSLLNEGIGLETYYERYGELIFAD